MLIPKPTHKRRKPEPVIKIKLQDTKECWGCGSTQNLERHHCVHGTGNRQKSEKYGLVVWLCSECHRGIYGVHFNSELDNALNQVAQDRFEQVHGRVKWMNVFGKSYL